MTYPQKRSSAICSHQSCVRKQVSNTVWGEAFIRGSSTKQAGLRGTSRTQHRTPWLTMAGGGLKQERREVPAAGEGQCKRGPLSRTGGPLKGATIKQKNLEKRGQGRSPGLALPPPPGPTPNREHRSLQGSPWRPASQGWGAGWPHSPWDRQTTQHSTP